MTKVTAYIGLGSNLATPIIQIKEARQAINALHKTQEITCSSLFRSPPMGPQDQPDYVNAVMAIETELPALALLHSLQKIELEQGRVRTDQRWGARTLDLDILLYAEQMISQPDLIIPHYGLAKRAFVLYPLQEIAPKIQIPGLGPLSDLVNNCPLDGLAKLP